MKKIFYAILLLNSINCFGYKHNFINNTPFVIMPDLYSTLRTAFSNCHIKFGDKEYLRPGEIDRKYDQTGGCAGACFQSAKIAPVGIDFEVSRDFNDSDVLKNVGISGGVIFGAGAGVAAAATSSVAFASATFPIGPALLGAGAVIAGLGSGITVAVDQCGKHTIEAKFLDKATNKDLKNSELCIGVNGRWTCKEMSQELVDKAKAATKKYLENNKTAGEIIFEAVKRAQEQEEAKKKKQ